MKKLILAAAALMVSLAAYGQGQFVFNNRIPPDINAKFTLSDGTVPSGSDYTVQLFGGPSGSASSSWTQLGATDFRTGAAAGYVNGITVTVPGATTSADLYLRLYQGTSTTGTPFGTIGGATEQVFTTPVGVAPNPPPNMPLGTAGLTFTTAVPEPTTLALGLLGLGSLLFIRRRK